jgi:hypothetical protein
MILSDKNKAVVDLANRLASTVEYDKYRVKACFWYKRYLKTATDTEQERVAVAIESSSKTSYKYVVWVPSTCDDTLYFESYVTALNTALEYVNGLVQLGFTAEKNLRLPGGR